MGRHEQREQLFKLLFRVEFNSIEEMPEQVQLFFQDDEVECSQKVADAIRDRFDMVVAKLSEIDRLLDEKAEGWDTKRMGKVDVTVLRLALYEMEYDDQVPTKVAINEAVEIAKKFGGDESPSFVNGVLARLVD